LGKTQKKWWWRASPGFLGCSIRGRILDIATIFLTLTQTTTQAGIYNALNFGVYEALRGIWLRRVGLPAGTLLSQKIALLIGCCAGIVTSSFSCPFKVIAIRQLAGSGESFLTAMRNVVKEQGVRGLWRGVEGGWMISPLDTSIAFFSFDLLKHGVAQIMLPSGTFEERVKLQSTFSASFLLLMGFVAKAISVCIIFPLRFGKDKLQSLTGDDNEGQSTIFDIWAETVKKGGLLGVYAGLKQDLSSACVKNAVRTLISERLKPLSLAFFYGMLGNGLKLKTALP